MSMTFHIKTYTFQIIYPIGTDIATNSIGSYPPTIDIINNTYSYANIYQLSYTDTIWSILSGLNSSNYPNATNLPNNLNISQCYLANNDPSYPDAIMFCKPSDFSSSTWSSSSWSGLPIYSFPVYLGNNTTTIQNAFASYFYEYKGSAPTYPIATANDVNMYWFQWYYNDINLTASPPYPLYWNAIFYEGNDPTADRTYTVG